MIYSLPRVMNIHSELIGLKFLDRPQISVLSQWFPNVAYQNHLEARH
jgi:hypothetical protein